MGGEAESEMTEGKRWRSSKAIRDRARELRTEQTPAEKRLWSNLRLKQLSGFRFRRQHPIGTYIVDFYCPSCRIVVEIDGDSHAEREEYDAERTAWLEEQGCRVIRFTNREVMHEIQVVLGEIVEACEEPPP